MLETICRALFEEFFKHHGIGLELSTAYASRSNLVAKRLYKYIGLVLLKRSAHQICPTISDRKQLCIVISKEIQFRKAILTERYQSNVGIHEKESIIPSYMSSDHQDLPTSI